MGKGKDPDAHQDPYLWQTDPGGPKTYGSGTLAMAIFFYLFMPKYDYCIIIFTFVDERWTVLMIYSFDELAVFTQAGLLALSHGMRPELEKYGVKVS